MGFPQNSGYLKCLAMAPINGTDPEWTLDSDSGNRGFAGSPVNASPLLAGLKGDNDFTVRGLNAPTTSTDPVKSERAVGVT